MKKILLQPKQLNGRKTAVFLLLIITVLCPLNLAAFEETGIASWYGGKFQGRLTANGETFDTNELTAAHKTLPFGTMVKVTNLENGKSVIVRINDRGPFIKGRIIDLSNAAADRIGISDTGIGKVRISTTTREVVKIYKVIQLGAYSDRKNAEEIYTKAEEKGFFPEYEETATGVIRVLLKNIPEDSVRSVKAQLRQIGIENVFVRSK